MTKSEALRPRNYIKLKSKKLHPRPRLPLLRYGTRVFRKSTLVKS